MRNGFYLHNFDTWTCPKSKRVSQYDLGLRCRGNIQVLRFVPERKSGAGVWITSQVSEHRAYFYAPPDMTPRELYRVAWRVKRLIDRAIAL